jgi:hypothetical protein
MSTKEHTMSRYTAEHRGGDWDDDPLDWCVIDEEDGLFGSPVAYDLTEQKAKDEAYRLNNQEETK